MINIAATISMPDDPDGIVARFLTDASADENLDTRQGPVVGISGSLEQSDGSLPTNPRVRFLSKPSRDLAGENHILWHSGSGLLVHSFVDVINQPVRPDSPTMQQVTVIPYAMSV